MVNRAAILAVAVAIGMPISSQRDQPGTGAIEGRVTFSGMVPAATPVEAGAQPVLYVDGTGGLRYAVVFLPDASPTVPRPSAAAIVNQRNFIFDPQVLAVRAGRTVRFTSDDPSSHNVRALEASPANTFNLTMTSGEAGPDTHRMAPTGGRPVRLSCDIHPWMIGWIYAFEHDRFAVTSADGSFRIANVPPGRVRVAVRQPSGQLARELGADVRAGETTRLDVSFTAADLGVPVR